MLLIGASGTGKTTVLLNLLLQTDWLSYDHLIIYAKTLYQEEYQLLEKCFTLGLTKEETFNCFLNNGIVYEGSRDPQISFEFHTTDTQIKRPEELSKKQRNLILFDDVILENNSILKSYFCLGRHSNCSVILLSQNYFVLDRHIIRCNYNFLISFKQQMKSLAHIHGDISTDLPYDEFRDMCKKIWLNPHNFVSIDLTSALDNGRYRCNFDQFYYPKSLLE